MQSFDDSICPKQHRLRNRQADLLCRLQIDHELKFRRLLDGKIGRLRAFQDSVHIVSGTPVILAFVSPSIQNQKWEIQNYFLSLWAY
jgi:hypothetical protein